MIYRFIFFINTQSRNAILFPQKHTAKVYSNIKELLFVRTFEVIKIGLYSSRVTHFSLEIFGFVGIIRKLLGNQLFIFNNYGGIIYMSNKFKYLKTEVRYATAVKTNLYNFKRSFK